MSLRRAAEVLAGGGVVALTGAGISAESNIPTFRDPVGLWERFDPARFGTWPGVLAEAMSRPEALADFLAELRRAFAGARPNPAHRALAGLERAGVVEAVVTQNVDGLHRDAGSRRVIELHGSFRRRICLACGHAERVDREEFLAGLDRAVLGLRTAFIPSFQSLLPRCSACGAPARPNFVAFGEAVHHLAEAEELAAGCRAMLVVGTHGEVEPAAGLPRLAARSGAVVVQLGPADTLVRADVHLRGRAGDVLPELAREALALREAGAP